MKKSQRRWIILLVALAGLLAIGWAFRGFLMANVIMPVVLTIWMILRVFMTVDQVVYWVVFIFAAFVLGLGLLPGRESLVVSSDESIGSHRSKRFSYWNKLIQRSEKSREDRIVLENNLRDLAVNVIATEEQMPPEEVRRSLSQRSLSLPDEVYQFLTPGAVEKGQDKASPLKEWLANRDRKSRKTEVAATMDTQRLLEYLEKYAEIMDEHERNHKN